MRGPLPSFTAGSWRFLRLRSGSLRIVMVSARESARRSYGDSAADVLSGGGRDHPPDNLTASNNTIRTDKSHSNRQRFGPGAPHNTADDRGLSVLADRQAITGLRSWFILKESPRGMDLFAL